MASLLIIGERSSDGRVKKNSDGSIVVRLAPAISGHYIAQASILALTRLTGSD